MSCLSFSQNYFVCVLKMHYLVFLVYFTEIPSGSRKCYFFALIDKIIFVSVYSSEFWLIHNLSIIGLHRVSRGEQLRTINFHLPYFISSLSMMSASQRLYWKPPAKTVVLDWSGKGKETTQPGAEEADMTVTCLSTVGKHLNTDRTPLASGCRRQVNANRIP